MAPHRLPVLLSLLLFWSSAVCAYQKPAAISEEVWQKLTPYFLNENHPAKKPLDAIFGNGRPLYDMRSLKRAGFVLEDEKEQDLIVARHCALPPGFLIKLYLEDHHVVNKEGIQGEWPYWYNRILGADRVRNSIQRHNYGALFAVPKKWIYPLPINERYQPGQYPKYFILVSEELPLVSHSENERLYKTAMTPQMLKGLYTIIKEAHLYDSIYADNNIFTKDGRIAFIDTEDFDRKPIYFWKMGKYFSPDIKKEWEALMDQGGWTVAARGGLAPAQIECHKAALQQAQMPR